MSRLPELINLTIGRPPGYKILDNIAKGGYGAVYKAESLSDGKIVAVKILFPSERNIKEFYREISIYNLLSSMISSLSIDCYEYIVCLYDKFTQVINESNYFVLVLEFVDSGYFDVDAREAMGLINRGEVPGITPDIVDTMSDDEINDLLADLTNRNLLRKFPDNSFWVVIEKDDKIRQEPNAMLHYMMILLKGLDFIHSKGVAHNDIKPANILVTIPDGEGYRTVKYADFGLSCTDETHPELLGTKSLFIEELIKLERSPFTKRNLEELDKLLLRKIALDTNLVSLDEFASKRKLVNLISRKENIELLNLSTGTLNELAHALGVIEPEEYAFLKCGAQGSPEYISPEYFFPDQFNITLELAQKDDIWALGLIFRFMTVGEKYFPFLRMNTLSESASISDLKNAIIESVDIEQIRGKKIIRIKEEAIQPVIYTTGNDKEDKIVVDVIELMSIPSAFERPSARELLNYIRENL